ncbi:SDR family oxidoreductase [Tahibacter soli]|jgi:NAD(P)-dependent dehydrogenase (short-subunit alcohol dehydrogenase family)|uniref:SDR family oxidoreductase n=1 Tax=Tahibacter soli TaxID=2983605 RepID=A0A9X3YKY9_9GAMM|nr:SDR family oxidoreductase [Tahibacter soli]MDC8014182.1 SDR family oxidoreductase [Tahibacter soli]
MSLAIVTGANRGLGLEFVHQLLARDWRVIAGCRKPGQALKLTGYAGAHPGRLHVLPLDVASERSVAGFAREAAMVTERADLLINNAGVLVSGERFGNVAAKSLADSFAANASGPLLLTQALSGLLLQSQQARIVNISSQIGSIANTQAFRTASYAMSKAALNMATRLMAAELAAHGAIVACFHPGWVQTDMGGANATLPIVDSVAALLARILALTPADAGRFIGADGNDLPW